MRIKVHDGLCIGDECPSFIIAEVGSNWTTLEDCLHSIKQAKECGADAVKFQLFNAKALYGPIYEDKINNHKQSDIPILIQKAYLDLIPSKNQMTLENDYRGTLPIEWLPKLKAHADRHKIEFMCSAFSPELIDAVNPYVNIHKIASAEMCHVRMLEKLREIGKPVIMSTGAHTMIEISQSLDILDKTQTILMYCVSSYPAQEVNLNAIKQLRSNFGVLTGFSDHTLDVQVIPGAAYTTGASVIEKHFTAFPEIKSPDRGHSLTLNQFSRMVKSIRGNGEDYFESLEESPMRNRHNRRLIAIKDIKRGDIFIENENFGIYRSLVDAPNSLSPLQVDYVNQRISKRDITAGDGIEEIHIMKEICTHPKKDHSFCCQCLCLLDRKDNIANYTICICGEFWVKCLPCAGINIPLVLTSIEREQLIKAYPALKA